MNVLSLRRRVIIMTNQQALEQIIHGLNLDLAWEYAVAQIFICFIIKNIYLRAISEE
jgi:hypothetical protein